MTKRKKPLPKPVLRDAYDAAWRELRIELDHGKELRKLRDAIDAVILRIGRRG